MTFLLASQNLPFAVAIGLMFALALVEGLTTMMGFGLSGFIDNMLGDVDVDVDVDMDVDADVDVDMDVDGDLHLGSDPAHSGLDHVVGASAWARLLGWMSFGRVPALVLLIAFLTSFGLVGFVTQGIVLKLSGLLMPASIAAVPAFLLAIPFTRRFGLVLGHLIPKDETEAVSRNSFVGMVAVVTLGTARQGKPAQAKFTDRNGQTHYVMVEPDDPDTSFPQGTEVVLVRDLKGRFAAIHSDSPGLSEDPPGDGADL